MIYLLVRNYGVYDGHRSPDLIEDTEVDRGYYLTEEAAETAADLLNHEVYDRRVRNIETSVAKAWSDYEKRVAQWELLNQHDLADKARPEEPATLLDMEIEPYATWLAGQDRWSDHAWYTVIAINPA